MPVSSSAFVRTTVALMLAGLAALAVIIVASAWLVDRTRSATEELLASRDLRAAAIDVLNVLQEAETGQRGYLLTGRDTYLAPFATTRATVAPALATLRRRAQTGPAESEATIARIGALVDAKLAELTQTIELAGSGRRDEAIAIVLTDRGKALMDEARTTIDGVVREAEMQAAARVMDQRRSGTALQWVSALGAALILLVVGGSAWTVLRYTRDLVAARGEVEALNVGLEQRVGERTADLGRANEEVQRYAYIVSHDLRAPLVNVMGYTSEIEASLVPVGAIVERAEGDDPTLAEARTAVATDLPEALGFIRSSTDRMDRLINAILKLSREGQRVLKAEAVALRPLLDTIVESVSHRVAEQGGTLAVEGEATIVSDRLGLDQVFANLIDNAVKYRHPGRTPVVTVRVLRERGRVAVEVADNGRGIAAADRARVFELFRRAGVQDQAGEGIGLAHVLALARRLGGEVELDSTPGQGSTFRVILPHRLPDAASSFAAAG